MKNFIKAILIIGIALGLIASEIFVYRRWYKKHYVTVPKRKEETNETERRS